MLIIVPGQWALVIFFLIFFNMKVCCVFSLESPHRRDSNECTQHTIIKTKTKSTLNYPKYNNVCSYGIYSKELKNEFEIAMANQPSVFEPLKFNCRLTLKGKNLLLWKQLLSYKSRLRFRRAKSSSKANRKTGSHKKYLPL